MSEIKPQFFEQLNRLLDSTSRLSQGTISQAKQVIPLDGTVSSAKQDSNKSTNAATAVTATEMAFVYSNILVQERGAFELPPGWPDLNVYPGTSFSDEALPSLDEPYLITRRVHAYVEYLSEAKQVVTNHLLTTFEAPFSGGQIIFPAPASAVWMPIVSLIYGGGGSQAVNTAVANLARTYGAG